MGVLGATMQHDHQGRTVRNTCRSIHIHFQITGITSKVSDLGQLCFGLGRPPTQGPSSMGGAGYKNQDHGNLSQDLRFFSSAKAMVSYHGKILFRSIFHPMWFTGWD
jgi:hypothetical protein